jgi:hypothetical protein
VAELELVRNFSDDDVVRALDGWQWLDGLEGLLPWFASPFGDLFLVDGQDGVWYLDLIEGALTRPWEDRDACLAALATTDGLDTYLLAGLAEAAVAAGIVAGADEVLAFTLPPVVGGQMTVDNLTTIPFVVGVDIAGQIHQQVKDLPPGTPISGFTIE